MEEIKAWKCTFCGYIISDTTYKTLNCNPECPGCKKSYVSEFESTKIIV